MNKSRKKQSLARWSKDASHKVQFETWTIYIAEQLRLPACSPAKRASQQARQAARQLAIEPHSGA
ncbi:hypothetical protein OUZ56_000563 [Daphnia magna]|uniref:Uncharacterized protein n=1 Tax=Daphnia magna TaxID=35525 RepID=A0ABR0A022_9CRUS|nr:hypothetical protein OUZ56_000563 [Daphnia magna]